MSKIELTEEETKLFDSAQSCNIENNFEDNQKSLNSSLQLTELLIARKAIPINRLKYFTHSEFQHGGIKMSRKEVFESNGTKGKAIFKHPHFIKYLIYFINGANVSNDIYEVSKASIENTSFQDDAISNIFAYLKFTKSIPKDKANRNNFANEIFKLVVDLGFEPDLCINIRKKIMT